MTTPSKLKPGAMVRRKGEPNAPIFTFVARHGSKYCRCQCDRYKGLDGPDDAGFVDVSDWDMARKYERVFVRPNTTSKVSAASSTAPEGSLMADGSKATERWYSAAELAGLAGLPGTERGIRKMAERDRWAARKRDHGKGYLYPAAALPAETQAALLLRERPELAAPPKQRREHAPAGDAQIQSAWQRYEAVPQHLKDEAQRRLRALQAVEQLVAEGRPLMDARQLVAAQLQREGVRGASVPTLCRWAALVAGVEKQHRMALLVPSYAGRTATVEIPVEAWDVFKADYLRPEAPTATSCYDRLQRIARVNGWALPSLRTFERRIKQELGRGVLIMARKGMEAFDKTFPTQERDRSIFTAVEAVNADGHKFDVFARWPDGTVARPIMIGVQDLYSGKLLGYRIADTESADLARFAFRDVVANYGIPEKVWLDNGRGFASKMLTGGTANRFRFKVRPDDPVGILTGLGCEIHWATPYHGQAKPIERAWRDLCDRVAKHPAFAGAYTGNKPDAKPENYGSKAVPLDEFIRVLNEEIAAHNARPNRQTRVCGGRMSFDDAFNTSYAQATVRRATAEQLRQLLLAADTVTSDARDGSVRLSGNRYWCEAIAAHAGQKLLLRFDPEHLQESVEVYTLAGVHLGTAGCIAAVGFADTSAAREHARAKKQYRRAAKQQLDAERRMDAAQVAAQLPGPAPEELPPAGVIAPMFGRRKTVAVEQAQAAPLARTGTDDNETAFADLMERMAAERRAAMPWAAPAPDADEEA